MTLRLINGATLRGAGGVSCILTADLGNGKNMKAYYVVHCVNIGSIGRVADGNWKLWNFKYASARLQLRSARAHSALVSNNRRNQAGQVSR
jgi:hypothetical protein